ncbi:hypothetical protein FHL15_004011 [Xylaria flabelliformis]|uniref:Uncharacterized protein n=1 Tax=Xylaria flabelliformis TaxID=2512241 RepID=A0A553I3Z7_9PEZI|nr:hypothetical protein FHL15_004011 [Xylaria flabelliformis]
MKFTLVFAALTLTASAYRCRFDRYAPASQGLCGTPGKKLGDQTENDACSSRHATSCYGRPQDTAGDANCWLIVHAGGGCDPALPLLANITCNTDQVVYVGPEHTYKVVCA